MKSDISVLSGLLVLLAIFKTESTNGQTILLRDRHGRRGVGALIMCKGDILGEQIIETFHVTTDIRYRFATTTMSSSVRNMASVDKEVIFSVNLPEEAFIVKFNMMIDGKDYEGEVKEKGEAKKQYTEAKIRRESAGYIRQTPRFASRFDMSVNVASDKIVNFTLVYQELLIRDLGLYEYEVHVDLGQAVEDFKVEVAIFENRPLLFVKTPKLRTESLLTNEAEAENNLTSVERPNKKSALIKFYPTLDQQGINGLSTRFVVQYDVDHAEKGTILWAYGYFIHLFVAHSVTSLPKDIIFVLDTSGSMSGIKIAQLQAAMETILNDLREDDRFNIIAFSSYFQKMESQLIQATSENIESAKRYVSNMRATGDTNINVALIKALNDLKTREPKSQRRVGMVFFLTDGQPTSGETNSKTIVRNVKDANENIAIFSLAFGREADFQLLNTISTQNSGFVRKIYLASDAALQVEHLYKEISSVAMKNVHVEYLQRKVRNTTKTDFPLLPTGGEIVIGGCIDLGQYKREYPFFKMVGKEKKEDVVIEMYPNEIIDILQIDRTLGGVDKDVHKDYSVILEKIWAYLTVKQLLKEKEGLDDQIQQREKLDKRILELSLKYQFVTPLTSMVVTKPYKDKLIRPFIWDRESVYQDDISAISSHNFGQMGSLRPALNLNPKDPFIASYHPIPVVPSSAKDYHRMPAEKSAILTSLIIKANGISMCFVPENAKPGKYTLAEFINGGKITMETKCIEKPCLMSIVNLKLVDSISPSNNQFILNMDKSSKFPNLPNWKYVGNGLEFNISQRKSGSKLFVSLEVKQKSKDVSLTNTIALLKYKEIKYPKMPRGCKGTGADRTAILYLQK